jgi:hypothetical protein
MISRPPGDLGLHTLKTQPTQIQFINEYIDDPNRVVCCDVIIQALRE